MILSKTPLRVSFVGGGTDYFTDFETHGRVIVTTINKYLYVLLNKKYDQNIRISYSETENGFELFGRPDCYPRRHSEALRRLRRRLLAKDGQGKWPGTGIY